MATVMTREQAAAAVTAATAERDGIQANLLDLDGSFGKRMLAGTALTGESKQRWEAAPPTWRPCGRSSLPTRRSWTRRPSCWRERAGHPTGNWRRSPPC